MTDMDTPAGEALIGRRRAGGRAAHERSRLPQQRPFRQPRFPYEPTRAVSDDELEAIHRASLRVLAETGMDFLDPDAREHLRQAGAHIEDGAERVRFDPEMVEEVIRTVPAEFTLHARNPERHLRIGGSWTAFGTVGSPPNVADLDRGRRIGNREDYQNLLRLGQSLNSVHFLAGYPVEPVDVHHGVRYLHATHDALTFMDKAIHCYSLGRQRNLDVLEMIRIARGVDEAILDTEPSVFTVVNTSSPLRLDTPMSQGVIAFAERNQIVCITPFTLSGAMAPVTLAGALVEQNAEALATILLTQIVRATQERHLQRATRTRNLQRRLRVRGSPRERCGRGAQ